MSGGEGGARGTIAFVFDAAKAAEQVSPNILQIGHIL